MDKKIFSLTLIILVIFISFTGYTAPYTGVKDNVKNPNNAVIYVGNSRAMHLSYLSGSYRKNFVIIYSNGGSLETINPNKVSGRYIGNYLKQALKKYPKAIVIFALGLNGNGNPSHNIKRTKYYDYYMRKYPNHIYVISNLGGTGSSAKGSYKNSKVISFNKLLKKKYANRENEGIYYYDTYSFFKNNHLINPGKSNKGTRDGLHYQTNVYIKLLKNIKKFIKGQIK